MYEMETYELIVDNIVTRLFKWSQFSIGELSTLLFVYVTNFYCSSVCVCVCVCVRARACAWACVCVCGSMCARTHEEYG